MTTRLSQFNNTGIPLGTGLTFTGRFERTLTGLEISTFVNCSGLSLVTIEQSLDASNVQITTTFNYDPVNDVSTFSVPVALPFFRVKLFNGDIVAQAYLSLNTYVINTPPQQVIVAGGSLDVIVGGVVDVSGSVVASNLITETLATRRVDFLVVGDYYRVASVGITTGAEWQVISGGTACVGGQSVPDIGRLFKCVVVGPAVGGGGTCYDVEYTDDVSATITNFPVTQAVSGTVSLTDPTSVRVRDSNGDPIVTTAGNLMVGIGNIYTANPLHTIVDSGSIAVSSLPSITGSVSATITTNPVIVKEKPSYTVNLDALDISSQTIRNTAGCLSGLCLSHVGGTQFCFFKIYNASSATFTDTPLATFSVHKDTTIIIDTHAMNFSGGLCVRGTDNYAASDNTPPTGSLKLVAFVTGYSE